MTAQPTRVEAFAAAAGVALLALAARLAVLPFATTDGSNPAARVWISWRWIENPEIITHGVWGPLHFYLIGSVLALTGDPVTAPIVLHVAFGVASAVLFYAFVRLEFAGRRGALLVALAFAIYPIVLRNSVSVRAEAPFVFFVLATAVFLALARRNPDRWGLALAGGISLTFASMLRYEGWMLTPMLAVVLWPKRLSIAVFLLAAALFPVVWMVGNYLEYGDPLWGISYARNWELHAMGMSGLGLQEALSRLSQFAAVVTRGLTLPLSLLVAVGAVLALWQHRRLAVWLVPPAGLLILMGWSVANGSLVPKHNYTATIGTLSLPFAALALRQVGVEGWRGTHAVFAGVVLLGLVAVSSCEGCLQAVGLGKLHGISPIPRFANQAKVPELAATISRNLVSPADGVISDWYGYGATNWALLLARVHPDQMFLAPWGPNQTLDRAMLNGFMTDHPDGVLVLRPGSRFAQAIGADKDEGRAVIGTTVLDLERLASFEWPQTDWRPLGEDDKSESRVVVLRYRSR